MKKFFNIGFIALFAMLVSIAVVSEVKGNHEISAITSVATLAIGFVKGAGVHSATQVFGLQKYYFSEMDSNPLSRAEKELWSFLMQNAKEQTKADLKKGALKIEKYARSLRVTIPVSSTGRRQLINAQTVYTQGAIPQEWHQGKLPEGCNIAVSHIGLGFASDAAITVPYGDVDYGTVVNSWPAGLRNSELIFSQNGMRKGGALDCAFMGSKAASFGSAVESDGLELDRPMILEEGKPILIEQDSGAATYAATPAYQFLEINLLGVWVRPKS